MKKCKTLLFLLSVFAAALILAGCGPFDGYDDDSAIIKGSSSSTLNSSEIPSATKYNFTADKFNGVKKIKSITIPANPVFNMTVKFEEGEFKVVLVKDNTVFLICDSETDGPVNKPFEAGTYTLKIVGRDAKKVKFTFNYTYE